MAIRRYPFCIRHCIKFCIKHCMLCVSGAIQSRGSSSGICQSMNFFMAACGCPVDAHALWIKRVLRLAFRCLRMVQIPRYAKILLNVNYRTVSIKRMLILLRYSPSIRRRLLINGGKRLLSKWQPLACNVDQSDMIISERHSNGDRPHGYRSHY